MPDPTPPTKPAPPAAAKASDKDKPVPTPIQPPFSGVPEPPDEDEEKERALAGYKATAQQAKEPFEADEDFDKRMKKHAADHDKQQKDAEAETKKLMDVRKKNEEAAAKK